jgi:predicted DCC family thiol-disulfide oxidoreductase YuxK
MTAAPHIAPDIAVFYDGHCPVCRFEVRLYERLDTAGHIQWTDIETLHGTALPAGKTREDHIGTDS